MWKWWWWRALEGRWHRVGPNLPAAIRHPPHNCPWKVTSHVSPEALAPGPRRRPSSCAPFYGRRVLPSPGEWAETRRGHHPLISLLQVCWAPLEGKRGCRISLPGSGRGHLGTAEGLKGAQQGRGTPATWQGPSAPSFKPAPPHLSHQAPRLHPHSQSLGPGGGVCPASLPERRSGCATRAARTLFPAESLFFRVRPAAPTAPRALLGAPAPCAQATDPLCNPSTDFLPALRGAGAAAARSPLHTGPAAPWRLPRLWTRRGLTCWEQTGAGWSKSRGEARPGVGPFRSKSSSSSSPSGGPGRTDGGWRGAPMAPPALWRSARPRAGGATTERPGLPSAQQSPVGRVRPLPASTSAEGRAASGGRTPGWAHPLRRPFPGHAAQVRALPALLPAPTPAPPTARRRAARPSPAHCTCHPALTTARRRFGFRLFSPLLSPHVRLLCVDVRPQLESQESPSS